MDLNEVTCLFSYTKLHQFCSQSSLIQYSLWSSIFVQFQCSWKPCEKIPGYTLGCQDAWTSQNRYMHMTHISCSAVDHFEFSNFTVVYFKVFLNYHMICNTFGYVINIHIHQWCLFILNLYISFNVLLNRVLLSLVAISHYSNPNPDLQCFK